MQDHTAHTDYICMDCGCRTAVSEVSDVSSSAEHFCRQCKQMKTFIPAKKKKGKKKGSPRRYSYRDEKNAKTKAEIKQFCTQNQLQCRFVGTNAYIQTPVAEWFFDFSTMRIKLYHENSIKRRDKQTGKRRDFHLQHCEFYDWRYAISYIIQHDRHILSKQTKTM